MARAVSAPDPSGLDGAAGTGAKLVFADNLYAYGPMTEMTPQRAQGRKGSTRIEMADALLRAHADGTVRVTIGRSSDYYGPRGIGTTAGDKVMKPALHGKRARWLGSLDQPHTGIALMGAISASFGSAALGRPQAFVDGLSTALKVNAGIAILAAIVAAGTMRSLQRPDSEAGADQARANRPNRIIPDAG